MQTRHVIAQTAHAMCLDADLDADLDASSLLGAICGTSTAPQLTSAGTVLDIASLEVSLSMTEQHAAVKLVVLSSLALSVLT